METERVFQNIFVVLTRVQDVCQLNETASPQNFLLHLLSCGFDLILFFIADCTWLYGTTNLWHILSKQL